MDILYFTLFATTAALLLVAVIIVTKAIKEINVTVKVYHSNSLPADAATKATKPPTLHLTDAIIKQRREALKDK